MAKKGKAIQKWDAELAKYAAAASDKEQMPAGQFVGTRAGVLAVGGSPMKDNRMEVVILDFCLENALYEGKFDPDNPVPPVCFALNRDEDSMEPHDESADKQHENCAGCPQNEFGSGEGKGKACKNQRRLALISADNLSAESVEDGDIVFMKVPPTSLKGWAYFVKALNSNYQRPPFGMITEISLVPDSKTQFKVVFSPIRPVPDAVMSAIMERRAELEEGLLFPYQKASEEQRAAAKRGSSRGQARARRAAPPPRRAGGSKYR